MSTVRQGMNSSSVFCSSQALNKLHNADPHWGRPSALLSPETSSQIYPEIMSSKYLGTLYTVKLTHKQPSQKRREERSNPRRGLN
jgi:hypothetical protein